MNEAINNIVDKLGVGRSVAEAMIKRSPSAAKIAEAKSVEQIRAVLPTDANPAPPESTTVKVSLSKEQLKQLQQQRGKLDLDSGKVFDRFAGAQQADKLFHGNCHLTERTSKSPTESFSLQSILHPRSKAADAPPTKRKQKTTEDGK